MKETHDNDTKIGSNYKEIINIKNKQNEDDNDDSDDGFYITSTTNNIYTDKELFHNDILLQGKSNIVVIVVCPIPNIKERGKKSFPARLYVITTKANVWLAFSLMYHDLDKCPFSETFWQSKVLGNAKEEDMEKAFKFHLLCDIPSKQSALISKPSGRTNNNSWKTIVRIQKVDYKQKNNEKIYQWGKIWRFTLTYYS